MMTTEQIKKLFDKYDEDFLEFDHIPPAQRRHVRPDLCALLYLHEKFGGTGDAIGGAAHDEIFLDWEGSDLEKLTDEDALYLVRCGVHYDAEYDALAMFV